MKTSKILISILFMASTLAFADSPATQLDCVSSVACISDGTGANTSIIDCGMGLPRSEFNIETSNKKTNTVPVGTYKFFDAMDRGNGEVICSYNYQGTILELTPYLRIWAEDKIPGTNWDKTNNCLGPSYECLFKQIS